MILALARSLRARQVVRLPNYIRSGDASRGKSAENTQELVKMNVMRAVLMDLPAGKAFAMAAGSFV